MHPRQLSIPLIQDMSPTNQVNMELQGMRAGVEMGCEVRSTAAFDVKGCMCFTCALSIIYLQRTAM